MIHHIVMWKLETKAKTETIVAFKQAIEALSDLSDDIIHLEVVTTVLDSSNMDMMLVSVFKHKEALTMYQNHPKHIAAAALLQGKVSLRSCVDYEGA